MKISVNERYIKEAYNNYCKVIKDTGEECADYENYKQSVIDIIKLQYNVNEINLEEWDCNKE